MLKPDRLLVQQARQALATHPAETHSADTLAALLNASARTLHRQLKDEGASLQALKDEVRLALGTDMLLRICRPIKQVAKRRRLSERKKFYASFQVLDLLASQLVSALSPVNVASWLSNVVKIA